MAETVKKILEVIGINPGRFEIAWASAAEAPRFVKLITDFTGVIQKLGPFGENERIKPEVLKFRLEAARNVASNTRFRAAFGNLAREIKKAGDYSLELISARVGEKLLPLIKKELLETEVKHLVSKGPISVDTLEEKTGASSDEIISILQTLSKRGHVIQEGDIWHPKREGD